MKSFRLSSFEDSFDSGVLKRGMKYVKRQRISEIKEAPQGSFSAVVHGSERYLVHVILDSQSTNPEAVLVTDISCTCPYDFGPHCKHQAAVLTVLREQLLPHVRTSSTDQLFVERPHAEIPELLSKLSRSDLENLVLAQAENDHIFALSILAEHIPDRLDQTAAALRSTIQAELSRFQSSWDTREYQDSFAAAEVLTRLCTRMQIHRQHGAYDAAFAFLNVLFDEAYEAMSYAYDGDPSFEGAARMALREMIEIAKADIDPELRTTMMAYVEQQITAGRIADVGDWSSELWHLATTLVRTPVEYRKLRATISATIPPDSAELTPYDRYTRERLLIPLTGLMDSFGDHQEAEALRRENRHIAAFREQLIDRAWEQEDFEDGASLAEEGIAHDRRLPGLMEKWRAWALKLYQAMSKTSEAQRIARDLVLSGEVDYLGTMRNLIPAADWPAVREDLIHELEKAAYYDASRVLPEILVLDGLWERLMSYVETKPRLVSSYGDRLFAQFPERVRNVWTALLMKNARATYGRQDYRYLAASLKKYAAVAGREAAIQVRNQILEEFPRRRAMRDELSCL